ncbi:MAG: biopolymer transporter ExbD [Planctomycetota bacterium]|nr:biopolymer transporter ExbD [Planctomycetota bacterium]
MKIVRQRKPQMKMEMSPLIDCIFQLLIFFMLSSTFLTPSIPLSLPTAAAGGPPQSQQVIITLDAEGKVFLNKQPSSFEQLERQLRELLAESSDRVVTIRADQQMTYQHFVRALDIAKRSGAEHVNIAHSTDE